MCFQTFAKRSRRKWKIFKRSLQRVYNQPRETSISVRKSISRKKDNSVFHRMDVPGIKKDELEIKVEEDVLSIKGEKKLKEIQGKDYTVDRLLRWPSRGSSDCPTM